MSDLMTSFSKELITNINIDKQHIQFEELDISPESLKNYFSFYLVKEISEGKSDEYRMSMANVIANLYQSDSTFIYILSGTKEGINLYIGVASEQNNSIDRYILKNAFEGNFIGSQLQPIFQDDQEFLSLIDRSKHVGIVTGIPSIDENNESEDDFQGIERLAKTLVDTEWQLIIVAESGTENEIRNILNELYQFSTDLSTYVKVSSQNSTNTGWNDSKTKGTSNSKTSGTSSTTTTGKTEGSTESKGGGKSSSTSKNESSGKNEGSSESKGGGSSNSKNDSTSKAKTKSVNENHGEKRSTGDSSVDTRTWGTSDSTSSSWNKTKNIGVNSSISSGVTTGESSSWNKGTSESSSKSEASGSSESLTEGSNESITTGKSGGGSQSKTFETVNKRIERLHQHITEYQIPRYTQGLSKGMFKTAIYVSAPNLEVYQRLSGSVKSIFQGSEGTLSPLQITKLEFQDIVPLHNLFSLKEIFYETEESDNTITSALIHGTTINRENSITGATWLNIQELSLVAGLPAEELPGLKLRKSVSFAVNTDNHKDKDNSLPLGNLIQDGRILDRNPLTLLKSDLNKHLFVTGVTGSGKTTTCMNILLGSGFPFMVVEPAKTEYRALYEIDQDIQYYSLGREDLTTFRLNPFELISPEQNLTGHVSMLKSTITAVFPMEASMPFIVEQAIMKAYENKGWDIVSSTNFFVDDPWKSEENVWPTFSDMIGELEGVIKSAGMGQEFEEKYLGSLVSRLSALTQGIKGTMINTIHSMNFDQLLDQKVVIELEELKDEEDKAFFMALILGRVAETMKYRHRKEYNFKHMTLIEEAHRLLSKPEPGTDGSKAMGVEMFANLLAEVRKYGECLIIADQIPNKLISDVIKNTNIKIIHRLFAADDRDTIGDAIGLNRDQKDFLPLLKPGETIVYSGGWHAPVRAQIKQLANTTGQEIQEAEIANKGKQQLWDQRFSLFPQLSEAGAFSDPDTFATFIRENREILNIFIRVCKTYKIDPQLEILSRLIDRLRKNINELFDHLDIKQETFAQLFPLFCNDSLTPTWDLETQMKFKEKFPTLLSGLLDSTDSFKTLFSKRFYKTFLVGENKNSLSRY
ncbi:hypothetical protein B9T19_07605 [Ignatzschineria sp. F8392]|uniref:ATP-binding protein n=1 Tax=Ignatzschineria sp. F8392 TaxID=1980117 RepID=UPI000B98B8ED|nr:ATP-binding protein [Ignatzschineria sp. F8392]OYQ78704.1 hypothetical protein B9T19_07605 [Ignatzschineria sp. F8392]